MGSVFRLKDLFSRSRKKISNESKNDIIPDTKDISKEKDKE